MKKKESLESEETKETKTSYNKTTIIDPLTNKKVNLLIDKHMKEEKQKRWEENKSEILNAIFNIKLKDLNSITIKDTGDNDAIYTDIEFDKTKSIYSIEKLKNLKEEEAKIAKQYLAMTNKERAEWKQKAKNMNNITIKRVKRVKHIDSQGFQIEETFVQNQMGYWTRTNLQINGHEYCPFCNGFLDDNLDCKECYQDNLKLVTLSNEELEEFLKGINEVDFF